MTVTHIREIELLPPPLRGGRTVGAPEARNGSGGGQRPRTVANAAPHPILLRLRLRTIDRPAVGAV